jgi:hypothetical protein
MMMSFIRHGVIAQVLSLDSDYVQLGIACEDDTMTLVDPRNRFTSTCDVETEPSTTFIQISRWQA